MLYLPPSTLVFWYSTCWSRFLVGNSSIFSSLLGIARHRHRCSRFPLDSILSHTRTHHTETSAGRWNRLESADNYVTAIKQTRSTYATSQFVTVLHPSITWTDAGLRKYYLPPVFKGSIPFHPPAHPTKHLAPRLRFAHSHLAVECPASCRNKGVGRSVGAK